MIMTSPLTEAAASINDFEMLCLMGRPCCVNPQPNLREEAEKRGWEILTLS